jgi:hypothetical protein
VGLGPGEITNEIYDPLDEAPAPIPIVRPKEMEQMYTDKVPNSDTEILIMDGVADISCVGKGFSILFLTGEKTTIGVARAKSEASTFDIVTAATVIIDPTTSLNVILIINQAVYIPDMEQNASLLHMDQARNHNVIINDLAKCYYDSEGKPGRQLIEVDGRTIPLRHDGLKYFLQIREPREEDWDLCQIVELTSTESWTKQGL